MTHNVIARRNVLAGAIGLALTSELGRGAWAQTARVAATTPQTAPQLEPAIELLDAWVDAYGRPTAKVQINGKGPYNFMVDTGSNTTVIASRVVAEVGATVSGSVTVHGTTGNAEMEVVNIRELHTGVAAIKDIRAAVIPDARMPRDHGILGADVFAGRRLTFDILNRKVSVEPSRRRSRSSSRDTLRVGLRLRNRMLAEIDGHIGGMRARMMLDTGAQQCLLNPLLANRLLKSHPRLRRVNRVIVSGVSGDRMIGDYLELPEVVMGDVHLRDAGAVIVDAPVFKVWGVENDPVLIVGVNVLSRLSSFSIDYGSRLFEATPMAFLMAERATMVS